VNPAAGDSVADILPIPRKRRTREHVIADQSMNHVERFIYGAGYTTQRMTSDYGYDLLMTSYDEYGHVEPGEIYFQLKATDDIGKSQTGSHVLFSLALADYISTAPKPVRFFSSCSMHKHAAGIGCISNSILKKIRLGGRSPELLRFGCEFQL
jgi:hypothetical protein